MRFTLPLVFALALIAPAAVRAQANLATQSITYDVLINNEEFRVEGNRMTTLQSKTNPGTTYKIAIRIATTQHLRLNSVQFDYEMPAKVSDDRGRDVRVVQINHELGYAVTIADFGQAMDAKHVDELVKALIDDTVKRFEKAGCTEVKPGETAERKFAGATGRGTFIRYLDAQGEARSCAAYVLTGEKFAATCTGDFPDKEKTQLGKMVKQIMDSITGL